MAKLETKSISVNPDAEQSTIELWDKFGWSLISSQEIFNRDSHLERDGDRIVNVTETTNYVKLVFQRDKDMPYYNEVTDLERNFHALVKQEPKEVGLGCLFALGIVLIIVGAIAFLATAGTGEGTGIIMSLLFLGLGIFLVCVRKAKYKAAKAVFIKEHAEWEQKCHSILDEVSKYV